MARELLEKVAKGRVAMKDLEGLGLSVTQLQSFVKDVERARAQLAATKGGNSTAPPTFADFIKAMDATQKTGTKATGGGNAGSTSGTGKGETRGVTDTIKETVDLEYQDLLEEYYRSLADPAWKRKK